jgi:hypothetical protein
MFQTMPEVTVLTSDGRIQIEQGSIQGQIGTIAEITIDAYQVPLLCAWLRRAAAEVEANGER